MCTHTYTQMHAHTESLTHAYHIHTYNHSCTHCKKKILVVLKVKAKEARTQEE